ncbi:FimV family protein [Methylophilus sp. 'Pure River']|uniref:type IV pilus assembly protein FimV n=1 Tax=Methylophilus sp. 'Pure River' TaxID=3377117 RepID=UPI00398EC3D5
MTPLLQAAEFGALSIESVPGQPLLAQLPLNHVQTNTDISCFSLNQSSKQASADSNPVHLEYTTLGSQQGVLMLWSDAAIANPLTLTLTDRCQHSRQTVTIHPDNTVAIAMAAVLPPVSNTTPEPVATQPEALELPPAPPAIPVEAYTALQAQINDLQQNFKQLQTKSDVLYASNLAQADILATLKTQLTRLQNENHLLRTLVIALGLALIASGFFFADWLRRHAAVPKVMKSRRASKQSEAPSIPTEGASGPATRPLSGKPFSATVLPTQQTGDAKSLNLPTQPPTPTKTSSRLKSVPMHANDDAVMPHGVPQKVSSQQSTQTVMQDASRLFTHGRVNQAIDHLQQHLAKHPKSSPWMWLYLLDLLSKEGKQQEFDIVAGECRKHFNLNVEHAPDLKQQGIESFPRVMKALQQAWGTPQVIALIDDLVYNTRLVPRMGFERSVFEDLMLLKEIACQTQNLPAVPPAPKTADHEEPINGNLRELQQLSEDLYILAPVEHTPFQYWTDFTFELDEPSTLRKSA